jgi:hypothetical protein
MNNLNELWVLQNTTGKIWAVGQDRIPEQAAIEATFKICRAKQVKCWPTNLYGLKLIEAELVGGGKKFYHLLLPQRMHQTVHKTPQGC